MAIVLAQAYAGIESEGVPMPIETPVEELARLKQEQDKARSNRVFLGWSALESQQYDARAKRIGELILSTAATNIGDERQQNAWAQTSETDTPQEHARQPYSSREENSSQAYSDSQADSREVKRKKPDTE